MSVWSGYRCQCLRGFLFWPNEQPTEGLPISDCTYQIRLSTVFKNLNLTNPSWPESPAGGRFPRRDQVEFKSRKQKFTTLGLPHTTHVHNSRNVIRKNIRQLSTCRKLASPQTSFGVRLRDKRTPKDVCGEASRKSDTTIYIRLLPFDDVRRSGSGWRCITL